MELRRIDSQKTHLVLVFNGNLDANGSRKAQVQLDEVIADPSHNDVEVDFKHVQFLDSSGVGAIVYLYKRLLERDRNMKIKNVTGQPLEIMTLLHIDQAIPINSIKH
ncbi:anti-sigma factor antagonist [Vibrio sinensis]|uniref:Anti-sigma factor antagonist n=1 Tax=Vibrio sinensis TaxID=2302434 RepID=A0A3A6QIF5_9VIBR|nr:STAS domain-containing protein [Vibrio sinensis]RJX66479.1 anti-sigma factor antagonist [Vibrio sinensis]